MCSGVTHTCSCPKICAVGAVARVYRRSVTLAFAVNLPSVRLPMPGKHGRHRYCGNACIATAGTCPTNEVCSGVTHTCSCPNNMCGGSCCTGVQTECDAGVCCQPVGNCVATYACGSTAGTDNCGNPCTATAGTCPTTEAYSGLRIHVRVPIICVVAAVARAYRRNATLVFAVNPSAAVRLPMPAEARQARIIAAMTCAATAGTCPGCCTGSHTCATVDACGVCGGNGSECWNAGNCSGLDACFSSTCCGPYATLFTVATGSVY